MGQGSEIERERERRRERAQALYQIDMCAVQLIIAIADEETGLTIKSRNDSGRLMRPNIVGFRFVDWAVREKFAKTREEAVVLGQGLVDKRFIERADGKTRSVRLLMREKRGGHICICGSRVCSTFSSPL